MDGCAPSIAACGEHFLQMNGRCVSSPSSIMGGNVIFLARETALTKKEQRSNLPMGNMKVTAKPLQQGNHISQ